jgi:hypothetical protein
MRTYLAVAAVLAAMHHGTDKTGRAQRWSAVMIIPAAMISRRRWFSRSTVSTTLPLRVIIWAVALRHVHHRQTHQTRRTGEVTTGL